MRGKESCKPYLELLMGRIYAKHATSNSWEGIMQHVFCINPSYKYIIFTISSWEGFMQNFKIVHCKNIWVNSTIFWSSQLHACCVCDTLQTSRKATNLILNQSVVEKLLPLN